ncbi:MAG: arsenite methyltransferase [Fibrobacteria bacterium]|nr:arsenite methyltransferase [Fibrobacteria bacterium]
MDKEQIRKAVRESYGNIARADSSGQEQQSGCSCSSSGCCDSGNSLNAKEVSVTLGYSKEDVSNVPEGANMGLGCGNPQAIASLKSGETVIDLGSGGGFDCFLASKAVGESGNVIGVDMTPDMVSKARGNAEKAGATNVEFRLGEIEHLPVADNTADVIISNCVINLSPEKQKVYNDAYRVLKPGGRLAVSDIVTIQELSEDIQKNMELYTGCVSGASKVEEQEQMLKEAGFSGINIQVKKVSKEFIDSWMPGTNLGDYIASASIEAVKPRG